MGNLEKFSINAPEERSGKGGEEIDQDRRKFLKAAAAGAIAAGTTAVLPAAYKAGERLADYYYGNDEDDLGGKQRRNSVQEIRGLKQANGQHEIARVEARFIEEVFDIKDLEDPIRFSRENVLASIEKWRGYYKNAGKRDLARSIKVLGDWNGEPLKAFEEIFKNEAYFDAVLEEIFRDSVRPYIYNERRERLMEQLRKDKERVVNLAYLYIAETNGVLDSVSSAKACGPYQFIAETARLRGLQVEEGYDERFDFVRSAEACLKHMVRLYHIYGDWDLALSAYNGGQIEGYMKHERSRAIAEKREVRYSYDDFLGWMEQEVNKKREEIMDQGSFKYKVMKGERLGSIGRRFSLSQSELDQVVRQNNLRADLRLLEGQELAIPLSRQKKLERFRKAISGFRQNLAYPAKLYGIVKALQDLNLAGSYSSDSRHFQEIRIDEPTTLKVIAGSSRYLDTIRSLNPAVRNKPGLVPKNARIRLPLDN